MSVEVAALVVAAGLGLIFGSFATVASFRLPRGESIVAGRSRCPSCGATIGAAQNIPVLSYLAQRGRCRNCGERISVRYPLTEIATAVLFALAVWRFGVSPTAIVYAGFFWVLVVLTGIDLEHRLLPNRIVYPAFVVGFAGLALAALVDGELRRLTAAGVGALIFGGFLFAVAFIYPAGMGFGDVKLAFVLGLFLGYAGGPSVVVVGMFLSFVVGGVIGLLLMMAGGAGRKTQIPFGPYLALGTVFGVLFGVPIRDWYVTNLL